MSTLTRKKSQDNRCRNVFLNSSLKKRRRRRKFSFAKAGCVFSTVASRYLRSKTRSPLRWFTCSLRCELFFLSLFFFFTLLLENHPTGAIYTPNSLTESPRKISPTKTHLRLLHQTCNPPIEHWAFLRQRYTYYGD